MHIYLANKRYSSWSMRPWLVLHAFEIPFTEKVIPLKRDDTRERIASVSPSGKLPCLIDRGVTMWESLAIIDYVAETYPEKRIWPHQRPDRAIARAVSHEMHGGFLPLRQALPMNLGKRFATPALSDDAKANIARIENIWRWARARFGLGGDFLFGAFTAADAMYAPVVTRFDTYGIAVADDTRAYMDTVLSHPSFVAWRQAGLAEPWDIAEYEAGHAEIQSFLPKRA
jgi:glutathione S-transferase